MNDFNITINGNEFEYGDRVRVLKITDDSGRASDLFGVESHLDGWIDIVYIEPFEGVITFDKEKLMIVIKGKNTSIPLSDYIRYNIAEDTFLRVKKKDLKEIVKEYNLPNEELGSIVDYLVKVVND